MQYSQTNMEQEKSQQQSPLDQQQARRVKPPEGQMTAHNNNNIHNNNNHQPPPPQKCPRCDSSNTKFCYYNNYSLSQPRYFCKSCRRYWTHGGTLRNVPVGGGCRKSKRPKPSTSSSSSGEGARSTQSLSPALPSQSLTGMMISGQGLRTLPPVMPSIGSSFYTGGGFLSSLAAMQSLPPNQGGAVNFGGGNTQFGSSMSLLQGLNLPSMKPPAPSHQFQAQTDQFFPSQQNLSTLQSRPLSSWTQSFIMRGAASSSAASPSFWSGGAAADCDNQAGSSSFNPNQWSDNQPGFDPSQ
ncbi:hypothetical protein CDL12_20043 [Handroanthus impetiginosus]|uniref:Dof zinc finger protein n=1 Tax=Handroanthus impetiginosus TaxID=429701 RepID=A0A2G9GQ55_9LAMI|nr:hypothetical protein CDL12_20043 [Handroanthus impetiginosus]